jgi:hypothetical protein
MSWVSSSTTACTTTLDAKAARAAEVVGPGVVELSMSSSRRSVRRKTAALEGMSSILKSLRGSVRRDSQQDNLIALGIRDFDRGGRLAAVPPSWTAHQPVTSSVGVVLHSMRLYITRLIAPWHTDRIAIRSGSSVMRPSLHGHHAPSIYPAAVRFGFQRNRGARTPSVPSRRKLLLACSCVIGTLPS